LAHRLVLILHNQNCWTVVTVVLFYLHPMLWQMKNVTTN